MDEEMTRNLEIVKEIAYLTKDWDGYGAEMFSEALIQKCRNILRCLKFQPQIFPTGRQSIQFQYELEDRSYLEFEIFEEKTIYLLVPKRIYSNAETAELSSDEEARIKEMTDSFYGEKSSGK